MRSRWAAACSAFTIPASDILVTKTMPAVFGCVPAFDYYFITGFRCSTFCVDALVRIATFYRQNKAPIDAITVFTLAVDSGLATKRRYPRAKLIEVIFFQKGFNKGRRRG
jgi:hypothetical protein